jgi:septal ring factor EnvC (AmiA/AmiB activator)
MPPGRPRKNRDDVLIKSAEMIGWALGGIEREIGQTKDRLAALTAQAARLRSRLGRGRGAAVAAADAAGEPAAAGKRKRRKLSAEARKRISDNMRKRWAETKKAGKKRLQAAR